MTNDIRKLMETIEQINEVSDFDGEQLDILIAQFNATCRVLGIDDNPVKRKELAQVVLARADKTFQGGTEGPGGLGHDNALGNDHSPRMGGWPDEMP